jgi:hypothetical protein
MPAPTLPCVWPIVQNHAACTFIFLVLPRWQGDFRVVMPVRDGIARPAMDGEIIAAFLRSRIDAGDAAGLAAALGEVARAHGMAQVAREAGLSREALTACPASTRSCVSVPHWA